MQTEITRLRELTIRYSVCRDANGQPVTLGRSVLHAADAAAVLAATLSDEPAEVFGMLLLTTKHQVIAYHEVSRGQLDASIVHPREIFKAALLANAAAVILAHNHPSGDPAPSSDDIVMTRRLVKAGLIMGVPVLDHVVIGDGRYVSLHERGLV